MSEGSSSKETSSLILVSYRELHESLLASRGLKNISNLLQARLPQLRKWADPFGKPSPESKKRLESGEVRLVDGSTTRVSDEEKQESLKISAQFQLDEVEALVLLRSCFAHADLSSLDSSTNGNATYEAELKDALETYYFEQRHHLLRVFLSLLAASGDPDHPFHVPASDAAQSLMPDYESFALELLDEISRRARQALPPSVTSDHLTASRWARQAAREQLCLLEILFAVLWEINPCPPGLVFKVFEVLFSSDFGQAQSNFNHLMDEEGSQLLADLESFWVLITLQILALDNVIGRSTVNEGLLGDPKTLLALHNLITSSFRSQPRYGPLIMAWGIILSHLTMSNSVEPKQSSLAPFFEVIVPPAPATPLYQQCAEIALAEDTGLFSYILQLLNSPTLSSAASARKFSAVTTPNSFPYRLTVHYLVIGMSETLQIGYISDIDGFISVVESLFGSGERNIAAALCHKYWTEDWVESAKRQQLLQVAALRFPVQPRPLIRLLRALSGNGTDATSSTNSNSIREVCVRHVYHYLAQISGFAHIIQPSELQSSAYDVRSDMVLNVRAIHLPGGTTLPVRTAGQTLSMRSPGSPLAVRWSHTYSGWRVLLDILLEYVRGSRNPASHAVVQPGHMSLSDIGMEGDDFGPLVGDILALFRSVAESNMAFAQLLMENISGELDETGELASPDLVQVAQIILEDCLSLAAPATVNLATNALGILISLLPVYPGRVWPYLRSTHLLFSTPLFAAERALGAYTMTTAVVELVGALHHEARVMALRHSSQRVLQHMKGDVLLKGLTFIHNEVWLAYSSWRFVRLSDRFNIGYKVAELYCAILDGPEGSSGSDLFEPLTSFLVDSFLHNATVPCVTPLVSAISNGHELLRSLNRAHRFAEANSLAQLLGAHLKLVQLVIARKSPESGISLLEQTLFTINKKRSALDAIALLAEDKLMPLEAIHVLTALTATPISMVSHLSSPQRVTDALLHMVQHPYDDLHLRVAICAFISRCVASQPVFAKLFVSGEFKAPHAVTAGTSDSLAPSEPSPRLSVLPIALEIVSNWELLWDSNPELLSASLEILDSIWQRALEHIGALESIRTATQFWDDLSSLAAKEMDSSEVNATITHVTINESVIESDLPGVPTTCYQAVAKAFAVHILALDVALSPKKDGSTPPPSLAAFEQNCKDIKKLVRHAVQCGHTSDSTNAVREFVEENVPGLQLDAYRSLRLGTPREFGDNYVIDLLKVRDSVWHYFENDSGREGSNRELLGRLCQLNIEWSLIDSQISLTRSLVRLLTAVAPWLRAKPSKRITLMDCASAVAELTGDIDQRGDVMKSVHAERVNILLALAEAIGLSKLVEPDLVKQFTTFCEHLQHTIVNPLFPPLDSIKELPSKGFHRSLLQIMYFAAIHGQQLSGSGSKLTATQRQTIVSAITSSLDLVVDALRVNFDNARSTLSQDLDGDIQLSVLVFGQLVKPELLPNSSTWLSRCQNSDIIRASLELFVRLDLTGQVYPEQYRANHQALYARSIFDLHTILASHRNAAERLAHESVLLAYSANQLSPALEAGVVDVLHTDLPGERSPAHRAWCRMLSITIALIGHLSYNSHFVDLDVTSFVQLYRRQIMRTLEWSVGDPLTSPFIEEMLHVVELFHAIAEVTARSGSKEGAANVLGRDFVRVAHRLLQHLSYALAHPNHVLGLLEPLTADERVLLEVDEAASGETNAGIIDPIKRPVLARVGMALFRVVRVTISAVMLFVKADDVIVKLDESEWDHSWEKLQPTVTVSIEESSSVGTMIELGRTAIDVLRHLNSFKTPPAPSQGLTTPLLALPKFELNTAKFEVQTALELLLAYSTSQIVLWLREEDSERWEREIKGTVAEDVQSLLGRAVGAVGGRDSEGAGVFEVLAGFLEGKLSA